MVGCDGGSGSANGADPATGGSGDPMMSTYTVSVTVTEVNDAPTANADSFSLVPH